MSVNEYSQPNAMPAQQRLENQQRFDEYRAAPRASILRSLIRGIKRHPVVMVVPMLGLVLLLGVGMFTAAGALWAGSQTADARAQANGVEVLGAQVARGAPAMAAQSMEAMKQLDARLFWEAIDEKMRQSLAAQGIQGVQGVEQMFGQIRASGQAIRSYHFVAHHVTGSGETVSFFMAKRQGPTGAEVDVPFLITTNRQGQVTKVE